VEEEEGVKKGRGRGSGSLVRTEEELGGEKEGVGVNEKEGKREGGRQLRLGWRTSGCLLVSISCSRII
jgi:hypothetical protein